MPTPEQRLAAPPECLDADPFAGRLMTRRLVAVVPEATVLVALRLMAEHDVRHVPVIEGGRCLGLVFESDVLRGVGIGLIPSTHPPLLVAALCRPVPILGVHERRSAAARHMEDAGTDAVLVVEDGALLGIITATDLIRSLALDAPPPAPGVAP
ncbi:CBS domain-containing protein [Pseudonocardia sp. GCM10023141]|uniref:CBS domain-containing protein n=1 Tax=Pseudonocardia sp. GCM10023141 TaxID=3252653 RepID=UPI00361BB695